jgi:putative transposase
MHIKRLRAKAPRANAICERLLGSMRRECLDHIVVVSEAHLRRVLQEYVRYFNRSRPHQGIDQCVPEAQVSVRPPGGDPGKVVAFPILGGLHHDYRQAA